jgi:hypothetical protein
MRASLISVKANEMEVSSELKRPSAAFIKAGSVSVIASDSAIDVDVFIDIKIVDSSKAVGSCVDMGRPLPFTTKPNVAKAVTDVEIDGCLDRKMPHFKLIYLLSKSKGFIVAGRVAGQD